jgi:uncharacterized protein YidB (DUF937 family)
MLENLKDLVKQYAGDAIINNPAIPNERNDEAVAATSNSIVTGLKDAVAKGNISDVMNMFNNKAQEPADTAIGENIKGNVVQELMQKFGLDQGKATGIASSLLPGLLRKFVQKTNDPNDKTFDLNSMIGSLTGGGSGIGGDLLKNVTGGNNNSNDAGLLGKVKGLF